MKGLTFYSVNGMFGTEFYESITRVRLGTCNAKTIKLCDSIIKAKLQNAKDFKITVDASNVFVV